MAKLKVSRTKQEALFSEQVGQHTQRVHVAIWGVSLNYGYLIAGPHNKDYSILGSILGSPILGKYHILASKSRFLEDTTTWTLWDEDAFAPALDSSRGWEDAKRFPLSVRDVEACIRTEFSIRQRLRGRLSYAEY